MVCRLEDLSGLGGFAAEAIKHDLVAFIAWHGDGRLLTANPGFLRLTQRRLEEADELRWPENFVSGELSRQIREAMRQAGTEDRSFRLEGEIVRKDGTTAPVLLFLHVHHPVGSPDQTYYAFIVDVSSRRELEERLMLTQYAVDHFTDSSIWLDYGGRIVYVNEEACRLLGYSREQLLSIDMWDIDPRYSPGRYRDVWESIKKGGLGFIESNLVTRDGRRVPVEIHSSYIRFGNVERLIAFLHDVTERKRWEEALLESEEKFRVITDTALATVFMVGENHFIYANPAAERMTGYTVKELLTMRYWEVIAPEFRSAIIEYGDRLLRGEPIPGRFEIKFLRKDGSEGWGDVSVAPVKYPQRKGMVGVITALDITEKKKAEAALKESEEKFRVLSDLSPLAVFMYQDDKLIYANKAACQFTGYTPEEIEKKRFWDMVHPEYREMVRMYGLARIRKEPVPNKYDVKYVTRDGKVRWAEFIAGIIEYNGKPAGIVTASDITERKDAEIELREAKSQAELYVDLMGHDINNMNQAALGFLEMAIDKIEAGGVLDSDDLGLLSSAMGPLQSSAVLIDSVRKLQKERKGGLKSCIMDVGKVLEEVKGQFASVPGRDVVINYHAAGKCRVQANELLKDVFANLVGNSIKHSTGAIAINIGLQPAEIEGLLFCRVTIEDTGPGIPDERKGMIFTRAGKEKAKLTGRGLGLYLVKTLVDDYHGKIWVEDRMHGDYTKGARFVVMIPAASVQNGTAKSADACGD